MPAILWSHMRARSPVNVDGGSAGIEGGTAVIDSHQTPVHIESSPPAFFGLIKRVGNGGKRFHGKKTCPIHDCNVTEGTTLLLNSPIW